MGIVISHRFSTVRMADPIVVLNAGEVVERGSVLVATARVLGATLVSADQNIAAAGVCKVLA